MVYTYNEISFRLKKEGHSDTCYNMDGLWGHCAKCDKPVTKDKYCMTLLIWGTQNSQTQRDRKNGLLGQRGGIGSYCLMSKDF